MDRGHLKNLEDRKGRPARIVSGDPIAGEVEVLPSVEKLRGCRVAGNPGGRDTPPPPTHVSGAGEEVSPSKNGLNTRGPGGERVQFTL